MEKRIGTITVLVKDRTVAPLVNSVISQYAEIVLARQGLPFRDSAVAVISLIVEGDTNQINALSGKLGKIENVESKAVVTVLGFDRKGIIARVSNVLYERGINILDISQTILDGYFNMVMIVDLSEPTCAFDELQAELNALGKEMGLQIRIQKNEIFEAMHQI